MISALLKSNVLDQMAQIQTVTVKSRHNAHCPHGLHPAKIMGGENKHTHTNKKKNLP